MDIMTIHKLTTYGGICPECGQWVEFGQGEVDDDEDDKIVCPECGEMFQVNIVNKGEN